ncbi:hypothetical protein [Dyella sp. C9]|uniref:hypothetical protein n=1 Tax=Dyella sp. C9 TaxID=2202154 RepID=UPI0013002087|nr:hypothetical protein [Dyella sp. C9]
MFRHLSRHLHRCRVLFALALCAWLTLSSVAWAQPDCCGQMGAYPAMAMPHGADSHAHGMGHMASAGDSCCAPASANVPAGIVPHVIPLAPASVDWARHREVAPQPLYEPPLRPPVA